MTGLHDQRKADYCTRPGPYELDQRSIIQIRHSPPLLLVPILLGISLEQRALF